MTLNSRNFSSEIVNNIILDAGAIYLNTKFENDEFVSGTPLGATQGGSELILESEIRDIPVDGAKGSVKGMNVLESVNPKLKVNLLEITAQNLAMAIAGSNLDTASSEVYDIITGKVRLLSMITWITSLL